MADNTSIAWTDATWNPIRARILDLMRLDTGERSSSGMGRWGYHCEKVSPGCQNCYAERMNGRKLPAWGTGLEYTVPSREKVEVFLDGDELSKLASWKRPRRVFVESMSDLFGEWVPDELIDRAFGAMALFPRHTFQVLTKRADRMKRYLTDPGTGEYASRVEYAVQRFFADFHHLGMADAPFVRWPLRNVWLGVSVEDRARKRRIDHLRATPAALRFLSLEPLLEDLGEINLSGIGWVIVGGESGPGARPCSVDWIRSAVQQCQEAGVPVFVKQVGRRPVDNTFLTEREIHRWPDNVPRHFFHPHLRDRKGADPAEWPEDLRVQQFPAVSR